MERFTKLFKSVGRARHSLRKNLNQKIQNQNDGKLLVFEQYTLSPSRSLYHLGKMQTALCTNFRQGDLTDPIGGLYMTTTEAKLTLSPCIRVRDLLRSLLPRKVPRKSEINRVFIARVSSNCKGAEQHTIAEWIVRTQKESVKAAIISVMDAPNLASLLRFIMLCFDNIHKRHPDLPIVIMVKERLLKSYYGSVPGGAKNEIATRILADNKAGVKDLNAFIIISFESGPGDDQLEDAYSWLNSATTPAKKRSHEPAT